MTDDEFERLDATLIESSNKVLLNRREAYAQEGDRLANFKETATATGLTPEKVCEIYLYKALSAMLKILHGAPAIGETKLERFSDVLNYVRLAYALTEEHTLAEAQTVEYHPTWMEHFGSRPAKAANRFTD